MWAVCVGMLCVNVGVEIMLNGLFMQCLEGDKIMCCCLRFFSSAFRFVFHPVDR